MRQRCFSAEVNYLLVNLMKHRYCNAEVIYFIFSSKIENKTLSKMCGRFTYQYFCNNRNIGETTEILASTICLSEYICTSNPYKTIIL